MTGSPVEASTVSDSVHEEDLPADAVQFDRS